MIVRFSPLPLIWNSRVGEEFYKWDESFTQRMNKARENELIRFLKNTPS